MTLDQSLIDAAIAQLDRRFPAGTEGVAGWSAKTLREVNPYYWGERFADGPGPWPSQAAHAS